MLGDFQDFTSYRNSRALSVPGRPYLSPQRQRRSRSYSLGDQRGNIRAPTYIADDITYPTVSLRGRKPFVPEYPPSYYPGNFPSPFPIPQPIVQGLPPPIINPTYYQHEYTRPSSATIVPSSIPSTSYVSPYSVYQNPSVQTYLRPQSPFRRNVVPEVIEIENIIPQVQYVHIPHIEYIERYIPEVHVQVVEKYVPQVQYVEKIVEQVIHTCLACGNEIREHPIEAEGRKWHPLCYNPCAGCGKWIHGKPFEAGGKRWHTECYVTCTACGGFIEKDVYIAPQGQKFHPQCYVKCFACGGFIKNNGIEVAGEKWHRECYRPCQGCGRAIMNFGDGVEVQGQWWHRTCQLPLCTKCGGQIRSGEGVETNGQKWHRHCLVVCAGCKGQIHNNDAIDVNGQKWHRQCHVVCAGCRGVISRDAFEALGKKWHRECFKCAICGQMCSAQYEVKNGAPVHPSCNNPPKPRARADTGGGVAMRQSITAATLAEAERLDKMDGIEDGKFKGTPIICQDPEWQRRWAGIAAWEVSDPTMAEHLSAHKKDGSRIVVSSDGKVDGIV